MNSLYNKFISLSDENLLRRVERKESYQKEAVEAAYQILTERGYDLEYPFTEEEQRDLEKEKITRWFNNDWRVLEHHLVFKKFFPRISLVKLFSFGVLFTLITILSNSGITESYLYRQTHILSEQVISLGVISIAFDLILIYIFFFLRSSELDFIKSFDTRKFLIGLKTFLILFICISIWELLLSDYFTLFDVFKDTTYRIFLRDLWFGIFVAFSEEFVFKLILLVQILIRIPGTKQARILAFIIIGILFALFHIPIQLSKYGSVQYWHLIQTFIFSYFSCIVFVRTRNFPLVAFFHFLMNISYIIVGRGVIGEGSPFYFNWLLIFGMIYSIPSVFEHKIFQIKKRKSYGLKWVYLIPFVFLTVVVFFIPKQGLDYYNISKNYYQINEYQSAMIGVNKALQLNKENSKFYNLKGNVYYSFENYDSAYYYYNHAISLDSDFHWAIRNRGLTCKHLKKYNQGVEDLTHALNNGISSALLYQNRGNCYRGLREYDLAVSDFYKSLELEPYNTTTLYGLGRTYLYKDQADSCLSYLEKALQIDPNQITSIELMAIAYTRLEKYDTSNYIMSKAIEMGSINPTRFYIRGINYYHKEDYTRAISEFVKTLEFDQPNEDIYAYLGYSYAYIEDYEKGCEYMEIAAELGDVEIQESYLEYCR